MERLKEYFHQMFLSKEYDLRIRLFNILALAGIMISLIVCITSLFTSTGMILAIDNGICAIVGTLFMIYVTRTKRYKIGYIGTILFVFIFFFTLLFLNGGGYKSGMPSFFIFAVLFTVFMFEGKIVIFFVAAEMIYYSCLCLFAYYHPNAIQFFSNEKEVVYDTIVGIVVVSIMLAFTLYFELRQYKLQQDKLELERKNAEFQRKEAEESRKEAEKANEAKSIFLANMSHEIRTPINVMLGMNEMVLQEEKSPQISEYARKIQSAGELLTSLVNNVLDISKIESGKMELITEDYDLKGLIRELYLVGYERAQKKGLEFKIEVDPALPQKLNGDLLHIKQIALNLLSNAVKYTQQGSVTLRLQVESREDSLIRLYLAVSDTGVGISKENIDMIFEVFTRADLLKNRSIEGTGLGLSIAKKLSESMGGTIHVDSEYGKGSTFFVILPQRIVEENGIGQFSLEWMLTKKEKSFSYIAPGGKILVVDDNRENLAVMKALLAKLQLSIDTAEDGFSALELVKKKEYHAIFMDYMMPELDGIQTLHKIKEEIPTFQTPVIVLTADAIAGTKHKLLQSGFHAYLSKPVTSQELEQTLLTILPDSLIIQHNFSNSNHPKEAILDRLQENLALYDLVFEEGLKLYQNDFYQYLKIVEFFLQYYEENRSAMEGCLKTEDMDGLTFQVHSLKSKARAVGALELYKVALGMEERCRKKDKEFVIKAMPVLFFEWERVVQGLEWMRKVCEEEGILDENTVRYGKRDSKEDHGKEDDIIENAIKEDAIKENDYKEDIENVVKEAAKDDVIEKKTNDRIENVETTEENLLRKQCYKYIEEYQSREAVEIINRWIALTKDEDQRLKLNKVKKLVEDLDYEEAAKSAVFVK